MNKKILLFMVFILVVYLMLPYFNFFIAMLPESLHFAKHNERYISKNYNIEVEKMSRSGDNLFFFGKEKSTDKEIIVIVALNGNIYTILQNEGITREDAILIAEKDGEKVLSSSLTLFHPFKSEEKFLKNSLHWNIVLKNQDNRLYLRFSDGEIYD